MGSSELVWWFGLNWLSQEVKALKSEGYHETCRHTYAQVRQVVNWHGPLVVSWGDRGAATEVSQGPCEGETPAAHTTTECAIRGLQVILSVHAI